MPSPNDARTSLRQAVFTRLVENAPHLSKAHKDALANEQGVAVESIHAHHAIITGRAKLICREEGLHLQPHDLLFALAYNRLVAGRGPEEQTLAMQQVAKEHSVSFDSLMSAVKKMEDFGHATDQTPKTAPKPPKLPSTVKINNRRGGEFTDYTFPTKLAFHRQQDDFILRSLNSLTPAERAVAKLLCLPSRKSHLEIARYIKLGIRPQNIVAVEGGHPDARREFRENLAHLGEDGRKVVAIEGRLEDFLPTYKDRFTFVILDFHNSFQSDNLAILQQVPLADRSFILTNFLAAREDNIAKSMLSRVAEKVLDPIKFVNLEPTTPQTSLAPQIERKLATKESRGLALDWLISVNVGNQRIPALQAHTHSLKRCAQILSSRVRIPEKSLEMANYMKDLLGDMLFPFFLHLDEPYSEVRTQGFNRLHQSHWPVAIGMCAIFGEYKCSKMEKYRYLSQNSRNHSPFFSSFMALEFPRDDYAKWLPTASFVRRIFETYLSSAVGQFPERQFSLQYTDDQLCPKLSSAGRLVLRPTDRVTFFKEIGNGQMVPIPECSIDVATISQHSIEFYRSIEDKYPFNVSDNVKNIPRIDITP